MRVPDQRAILSGFTLTDGHAGSGGGAYGGMLNNCLLSYNLAEPPLAQALFGGSGGGASLVAPPAFTPLATAIPGQPTTTTFTDTNAFGAGPWFYRVGVSAP